MTACARCGEAAPVQRRRWCAACELAYDGWSRRYAGDLVWQILGGTVVVTAVAIGLPMLGASSLAAVFGIVAGAGTTVALNRLTDRRRRRQYLAGGAVPRAYLPPTLPPRGGPNRGSMGP